MAPVDAATVLLLNAEGAIFMVRRGHTAAFMARAMVFPGGKVDAADAALAHLCDLTPEVAGARLGLAPERALAFYVAAARETFEEAGVLLALRDGVPVDLTPPEVAARWAIHRDDLNEKRKGFKDILEEEGLTLALDALALHAWWVTPAIEPRRFDTRFFCTQVPAGQTPLHDARETTAGAWLSPAATLAGYAEGTLELAPPTLRILLDLVQGRAPEAHPPRIEPQPHWEGKVLHLLLPGDQAFQPPGPGRDRILLQSGKWVAERA